MMYQGLIDGAADSQPDYPFALSGFSLSRYKNDTVGQQSLFLTSPDDGLPDALDARPNGDIKLIDTEQQQDVSIVQRVNVVSDETPRGSKVMITGQGSLTLGAAKEVALNNVVFTSRSETGARYRCEMDLDIYPDDWHVKNGVNESIGYAVFYYTNGQYLMEVQ